MVSKEFILKLEQCYPNTKEGTEARNAELPLVTQALESISQEISPIYDIIEPIHIGGAGLVMKVEHRKTGIQYALKLPRPRGDAYLDTVKQEMEHLINIRHENIIQIHYMDEVNVNNRQYPFFIMDYIQDAVDLRERLECLIKETKSSNDVNKITGWLAERLLSVARALEFLHRLQIIHFDVKPSNIFVDTKLNDRPVLADLGYAKKKTDSESPVIVGFTLFYAHPDLTKQYLKASSPDRVTEPKIPKNFKFVWDIYAFGKTTLELLAVIDQAFPDTVGYDAIFSYLHLSACRMLDGNNLTNEVVKRLRAEQMPTNPQNYFEEWQRLSRTEFEEDDLRYQTMSQIVSDLEKLSNKSKMSDDIPELNVYFPHTIHISEHGPAPFSLRVKKLIEHPTFGRLSEVPQLGLARLIYPPATHTRLDHSIGAFRNACQYIQSLYNDPYNPLFRQLTNSNDLKIMLVASLLHDLGYFPFAHELEGVSPAFDHVEMTLRFLDNEARDKDGHTIGEIISNREWGWGISITSLKEVLNPENQNQLIGQKSMKNRLLSSIIDGPLDVDKTDYLIRDSEECRLPYGRLIDYDRLIRTLTVILTVDRVRKCDPQIGVYEKGQSAAESLTFSRYLLYQALYWHHSARAIRVMLRSAATDAMKAEKKLVKGKKISFVEEFNQLLGLDTEAKSVCSEDLLDLIYKYTSDSGREMISLLRARNFYKRILTIHDEKLPDDIGESTWEKLQRVHDRHGLQQALENEIRTEFAKFISSQNYSKVSLLADERINEVKTSMGKENVIMIDIPDPSYGSEKSLNIMPEPERLQRNYLTRIDTAERISEVWSQVHYKLMRIAAKSRVYCHPAIRDTLMAALKPGDIKVLLDGLLDKYTKGV